MLPDDSEILRSAGCGAVVCAGVEAAFCFLRVEDIPDEPDDCIVALRRVFQPLGSCDRLSLLTLL